MQVSSVADSVDIKQVWWVLDSFFWLVMSVNITFPTLHRYLNRCTDAHITQQIEDATWEMVMRPAQHGSVRYYIQLFFSVLLAQNPKLIQTRLVPALSDFNLKYQVRKQITFLTLDKELHMYSQVFSGPDRHIPDCDSRIAPVIY